MDGNEWRKTKNPLIVKVGGGFGDFFGPGKTINWWPRAESNHRHKDFQSSALPTELLGHFKQKPSKTLAQDKMPRFFFTAQF